MDQLITYANKYKKYYEQDIQPIFHVACGCVAGQQVAFGIGRTIRKQLYEICGHPLTRKAVSKADLESINNLTPNRIKLLLKMSKINDNQEPELVLEEYSKLKGFGDWSRGAVAILMQIDNYVNLSSDAYIRKNLSLYTGKTLYVKECHAYIAEAGDEQTTICYFLWRIQKTSIDKVVNGKKLKSDDFV